MRKAILMMLLAVVSSSAMAEWVEVSGDEGGTFSVYANPATIRWTDHKVKMWDLYDYKTAKELAGKTFMSVESQSEYDCKEKQQRILYTTTHSENMGRGEVVSASIKPHDWEPNRPNSVGEALWRIACGAMR